MRSKTGRVVLIVWLCVTGRALPATAADRICKDDELWTVCTTRLLKTATPDAVAAASAATGAAKSDANKATAGATQGKTFSPALTTVAKILTAGFDSLNIKQNNDALTLELPFALVSPSLPVEGVLQGVIHQPTLAANLPSSVDATARDVLTKSLGDLDDAELTAQVVLGADTLTPREPGVVQRLFNAAFRSPTKDDELTYLREKGREVKALFTDAKPTFGDLPDEATKAKAEAAVQRFVEGFKAARMAFIKQAEHEELHRITDLLANDMKIVVAGGYRFRQSLVGQDTGMLRATLEWGFVNFQRFMRATSECFPPTGKGTTSTAEDAACLSAYRTWLENHAGRLTQDRLAVVLEYKGNSQYSLNLPAYGVSIEKPNTYSFIGTLRYGQMLTRDGAKGFVRSDVSIAYERVSKEEEGGQTLKKNSRFVATLSVTVRLSETLQVPVGIIYANKPEYLGDPDKRWGAHFGLTLRAQ